VTQSKATDILCECKRVSDIPIQTCTRATTIQVVKRSDSQKSACRSVWLQRELVFVLRKCQTTEDVHHYQGSEKPGSNRTYFLALPRRLLLICLSMSMNETYGSVCVAGGSYELYTGTSIPFGRLGVIVVHSAFGSAGPTLLLGGLSKPFPLWGR